MASLLLGACLFSRDLLNAKSHDDAHTLVPKDTYAKRSRGHVLHIMDLTLQPSLQWLLIFFNGHAITSEFVELLISNCLLGRKLSRLSRQSYRHRGQSIVFILL